jgi:hypothetical protein
MMKNDERLDAIEKKLVATQRQLEEIHKMALELKLVTETMQKQQKQETPPPPKNLTSRHECE